MEKQVITTEYINLMQSLKLANWVGSGAEVKYLVDSEKILVNGEIESRYRRKLYPGDIVSFPELQLSLQVISDADSKNKGS